MRKSKFRNYNTATMKQIINTMKVLIEVNKKFNGNLTKEQILNEICSINSFLLSKEDKESILSHFNY